jgi:hypothetical protein
MRRTPASRGARVAAVVAVLAALAGCGQAVDAAAAANEPSAPAVFGVDQAGLVLSAFDQADSAASVAGDVAALRAQEVSPSLDVSVGAIRRAEYNQRIQPGFRHINPAFALPSGAVGCFLVTATLKLTGLELAPTDVSQFVRDADGQWRLSHNVQVGAAALVIARSIAGRPATAGATALSEPSRRLLAAEVFARTTGTTAGNRALVASGALLDEQFAGGWEVYGQQLAGAGAKVDRVLDRAVWSDCAVPVAAGTLTFLTLYATDTLRPVPGGPKAVTQSPQSPDMIAAGERAPIRGAAIRVARVETFLLLIPGATTGATVLGLNDTALTVAAA